MNIESEAIYREIKKVIPTLNIIITYNTGIVMIENNIKYSTQVPMTEDMIQCYLAGLYEGTVGGLKYLK